LIDFSLPTKLCFDRLNRYTGALHRTIATAFADGLVDEDAFSGVGETGNTIYHFLAATALF
jgi:hypothetical protein